MGAVFLRDLSSGLVATLLLGLLLVGTGYLIGWTTDVWSFRTRRPAMRATASLVLAVAVVPSAAFLVARFSSLAVAAASLAVASACGALLAARGGAAAATRRAFADPQLRRALVVSAGWTALALVLLGDLQLGRALYPNIVAFDYAKHVSVTNAVRLTGVPPLNPSFRLGEGVVLYYYYLWFLVCALAQLIGGPLVGPRGAVFGGTVVAGLAIAGVVALTTRLVFVGEAAARQRRMHVAIAVALLAVGGLDIVAVLLLGLRTGKVPISAEWWNEQVSMWINSVIWVPHHLASLIAGVAAFLVLLDAPARPPRRRAALVVVAGLAIASGVGMSIWVALTFALFWALWLVAALASRRWNDGMLATAAGGVAIVAAAPFLLDLAHASLLHVSPVGVSIRPFGPLDGYLTSVGAGERRRLLFRLIALPLNYGLELGFFAVASAAYWWRRVRVRAPLERGEIGVALLAVAGLLVGTFLRSLIKNNDLGWRSILLVQFATLLWSASVVSTLVRTRESPARDGMERPRRRRRIALVATLAVTALLGVAASTYDVALMKIYLAGGHAGGPFASEKPWGPASGETAYDVREAYEWAGRHLAPLDVVQPGPAAAGALTLYGDSVDVFNGLYSRNLAVVGDHMYGTLYGIPRPLYDQVAGPIGAAFADSAAALSTSDVATLCERFGVRAWLVTRLEPAYRNPRSWVWRQQPLFANRSVRLLGCSAVRAG